MKAYFDVLDRQKNLRRCALMILSLIFLLFASPYTTPLNGYYGYDSSIFMTIGKAIAHGKRPYLDVFDSKGPVIFYLNALGYLIGGRIGVFTLQVAAFALAMELTYSLARLYTDKLGAWGAVAVLLVVYCGTVGEGNMTEEWGLSMSLLPLLLSVSFLRSEKPLCSHPIGYAFVYGVCAALQAMMRVTNAAIICGILLAFLILLIREREFAALVKNILAVLAGMAAVIVPFALYFKKIGAFDDFIFASITYNFAYAGTGASVKTAGDWLMWLARISMVPVGGFLAVMHWKKGRVPGAEVLILLCAGIPTALTAALGYSYKHYFLNLAPVIVMAAAMLMGGFAKDEERSPKNLRALTAAVLVFAMAPFLPQSAVHAGKSILFNFMGYHDREVQALREIDTYITHDRDSVLGYETRANVYLYLDVDPCFRYFFTQEWVGQQFPFVKEEMEALFREDPPVWIVSGVKDDVAELTGAPYRLVTSAPGYMLYTLDTTGGNP